MTRIRDALTVNKDDGITSGLVVLVVINLQQSHQHMNFSFLIPIHYITVI